MRTAAPKDDPTWYPETDAVADSGTQAAIIVDVVPLIRAYLRGRRLAYVSSDQFFYWVKGDISHCRAPDVYVIDGLPQTHPDPSVWKTWEGHHPCFALEVCSTNWQKDYTEIPPDYRAMGADELVIFDPGASERSRKRVSWQVFRRDSLGRFQKVASHNKDRQESNSLGCWLRRVEDSGRPRLRLGTGWQGSTLVPTDFEEAERERAEKEREQSARQAAEREVAALREELARLRGG